MEKEIKNCYNQDHLKIEAVYYCIECKIYICNKCENFHSKLFKNHHKYTLDKKISEIFTGFCKEENHVDKLEYYCKTHNILCCSGCIAKIKRKDKGQHSECQICLIEDIKDNKEKVLKENVLNLEQLSKDFDKLIKELKTIFEKINKDKEELKLNIQKIFTKIRNAINDREDELLTQVDELFDKIYMKENEINKIDKYPNKINILLKQGKNTIDQWNNENELNVLINNCIDIENNLININNIDKNLKKCKIEMASVVKFIPTEDVELDAFISNLTKFGKIFQENKYSDNNKNEHIAPKNEKEKLNNFVIQIKSDKIISNDFSIKLKNFHDYEYNIYYPNNINYDEKAIIFTFQIDGDNDYINELYTNKTNLENKFKSKLLNLFIRRIDNKLHLDFVRKFENNKIPPILYLIIYILNGSEISMKFNNSLSFEKFHTMTFEEFIVIFLNFDFSLRGNLSNLGKSLELFEKEKDKINIDKIFKNEICIIIKFLMLYENTKLNFDFPQEKLLDFLKSSDYFNTLKQNFDFFKYFLEFTIIPISEGFGFNIRKIDFRRIAITSFFEKMKSGIALEINTKGINDYLNKLKK